MKTRLLTIMWVFTLLIFCNKLSFAGDDEPRTFQLSLFPGLGTDGVSTFQNRYQVSLNLFMGVNKGVEGLELGGFMNINNGKMEGLQLAGFGNVVNGDMEGLQGSGFMNVVSGKAQGVNVAGFMNVIRQNHEGILGSGFMNVVNGDQEAVSWAGFMNVNKGDYTGIRVAGFMNVSQGRFDGLQGAGFMNVSGQSSTGISAAGFANVANGTMQGIQTSGFMNVANDLQGIQVSGFLNVAKKVEGIQLGVLNFADTISGVPIGFLSIVKKGGLRQFEIGVSDAMYANASFKIGVDAFYNIFSLGVRPADPEILYGLGYGIGSQVWSNEKSGLLIEGHFYQIMSDDQWWEEPTNMLSELRILYSHDLNKNLSLFAGPVIYNQTWEELTGEGVVELSPGGWGFSEYNFHEDWSTLTWVGARAGLILKLN